MIDPCSLQHPSPPDVEAGFWFFLVIDFGLQVKHLYWSKGKWTRKWQLLEFSVDSQAAEIMQCSPNKLITLVSAPRPKSDCHACASNKRRACSRTCHSIAGSHEMTMGLTKCESYHEVPWV